MDFSRECGCATASGFLQSFSSTNAVASCFHCNRNFNAHLTLLLMSAVVPPVLQVITGLLQMTPQSPGRFEYLSAGKFEDTSYYVWSCRNGVQVTEKGQFAGSLSFPWHGTRSYIHISFFLWLWVVILTYCSFVYWWESWGHTEIMKVWKDDPDKIRNNPKSKSWKIARKGAMRKLFFLILKWKKKPIFFILYSNEVVFYHQQNNTAELLNRWVLHFCKRNSDQKSSLKY